MKQLFALVLICISTKVFAASSPTAPDYSMAAIEVGFKSNSASITGSTGDMQITGYQVGISAVFNLTEKLGLKSGLFYTELPFKAEFGTTTSTGKLTYFEVPAFLMFKFEEYAGVYAGPSLGVKLSDEFSPGGLTDVKGIVLPFTFGAQFKFLPNFGLNAFFQTYPGEVAAGVENSRSVGVNLMFTLD